MAPVSSSLINFIDSALTGSDTLSYSDPDQKWIIRNHLTSLLQEFPTLIPFVDNFTHNDGADVTLLQAAGNLDLSSSLPSVHVTIWVHENYPSMPPLVFVSASSESLALRRDHPFVDPTDGAIATPYLLTWQYPPCNLSGLVQNLVNIFTCDHPCTYSSVSGFGHPLDVSKKEALDRLVGMVHYDMEVMHERFADEIEELSGLQAEMVKRVNMTENVVNGLKDEWKSLKGTVKSLDEQADVLVNWLKVNDFGGESTEELKDAFEASDEKSRVLIEILSADRAIEDLIYAMDRAVEEGAVSIEMYMKQVRTLAREQFSHKAMIEKLLGYCPN